MTRPEDDTKRLDWLERTRASVVYRTGLTASRPPWWVAAKADTVGHNGKTLREAVDLAMLEGETEGISGSI